MQAVHERNVAVVCNPMAGSGRSIELAEKLENELCRRKISHETYGQNWPTDFSRFTDVFIVGGDGTLNYFVNRYPGIEIPLSLFPGGSGNDFHWLLYGDKNMLEQLDLVLAANPKRVDAGKCNERLFMNGVGIGFDGAVAKSLTGKKKMPGKTSFLVAILKKIFFYRSRRYSISSDQLTNEGRQLLIGVANGRRAGGGFHIAPEASANDSYLDVILVGPLHPFLRLRWLPVIEKGRHLGLSFIKYFKTRKICISSDKVMQVHLDGEYCSDTKLEIEILPGKFFFLH